MFYTFVWITPRIIYCNNFTTSLSAVSTKVQELLWTVARMQSPGLAGLNIQ